MDVLVCVKRVPDSSSEVVLTDDGQAVDGRFAGFTTSAHEECAVELAVAGGRRRRRRGDRADPGRRGRRRAAALRARGRLHRGRPTSSPTRSASAPPTSPARSRPWCATTRRRAARTTWSCSATTPPTAATSRSASGSPTSSAGRSSTASRTCRSRRRRSVTARGDGPGRARDLPGAAAGGGDGPRGRRRAALPDGPGPDEGQEGARSRSGEPVAEPAGPSRVRLLLPPPAPSDVQILGKGAEAAPAVVDLLEQLGVLSR